MKKFNTRTIFYRRVDWKNNSTGTMQQHLANAHQTLLSTHDRTFHFGDGEIQGLKVESQDNVLFIHLALYTPHQPTSLVPFPSTALSKDTSQIAPPSDHNYLEGDIFFAVKGNHIVLCPSGARENVALSYINHVLRKVGQDVLTTLFEIDPVAKVDKVEMIKREGVKKIALNASLYEATVDYVERKTTKMNLMHGVAEEILALFAAEQNKDLKEISEMENLSVKLEISFDSRKKGGEIGRQRLEHAAKMLISDDEDQGFAIVTGNDQRLTANEIRISDKVQLDKNGNTVFRQAAFKALGEYLVKLDESGVLEQ